MLPISWLSIERLHDDTIEGLVKELAHLSGRLECSLHPAATRALSRAMAGINCYYSNLIEGHDTHPVRAERALQAGATPPEGSEQGERNLRLAMAAIRAHRQAMHRLDAHPETSPADPDVIAWLHGLLFRDEPEGARVVKEHAGHPVTVVPGAFRKNYLQVGRHVAPPVSELDGLMDAFAEGWRLNGHSVATALLMHHRLTYIHPFLDGNGRVARLVTEMMLRRLEVDGAGLWSLSRGLAKNKEAYAARLAAADQTRQGDMDGRGALSRRAGHDFTVFMLQVAVDQARFMSERLDLEAMKQRVMAFSQERKEVLGADARSGRLLYALYTSGPMSRQEASNIIGLSDRRAREVIKDLDIHGLVASDNQRAPLTPRFPAYAMNYLFPSLFVDDNPRRSMREALASPTPPGTHGARISEEAPERRGVSPPMDENLGM